MRIPVADSHLYEGSHQFYLGFTEDRRSIMSGKQSTFTHILYGDTPFQNIQIENGLPGNNDKLTIQYANRFMNENFTKIVIDFGNLVILKKDKVKKLVVNGVDKTQ